MKTKNEALELAIEAIQRNMNADGSFKKRPTTPIRLIKIPLSTTWSRPETPLEKLHREWWQDVWQEGRDLQKYYNN